MDEQGQSGTGDDIFCVCVRPLHLDALLVTIGGASRAEGLLFGEDHEVLVEENAPHARPLPSSSPAHDQLTLPHQLATLRHGDLKSYKVHKE